MSHHRLLAKTKLFCSTLGLKLLSFSIDPCYGNLLVSTPTYSIKLKQTLTTLKLTERASWAEGQGKLMQN